MITKHTLYASKTKYPMPRQLGDFQEVLQVVRSLLDASVSSAGAYKAVVKKMPGNNLLVLAFAQSFKVGYKC